MSESTAAAPGRDMPVRHGALARAYHWTLAGAFLFLLLTGFAPVIGLRFAWVVPHWITGSVLTLLVAVHILHGLRPSRLRLMWHPRDTPARSGKYTAAQRAYHWLIGSVLLVLVGTGVFLMLGIDTFLGDADPHMLTPLARGSVFVAHGLAALVSIPMVVMHAYFALLPEHKQNPIFRDQNEISSI